MPHPAPRRRACLGLLAASCVAPLAAGAQAVYPSRPLNLIVPYAAGGGVDTIIRLLAPPLAQRLGQGVVVENRAGVSGMVGAQAVARAPADGYTVLAGNTTVNAINPLLIRQLGYDPEADFAPVALLATFPTVLVVPATSPWRSVQDVVAALRAQPGKFSYGSTGVGSAQFLAAQTFGAATGTRMLHVPYKGSGQVLTDVMGGQIDLAFEVVQVVAPMLQGGRLRALGVTSLAPQPLLPGVPTLASQGLPDFDMQTWHALFVPRATPAGTVARLAAAVQAVTRDPAVRARMETMGVTPDGRIGAELAAFLKQDAGRWRRLIAEAGIQPQ